MKHRRTKLVTLSCNGCGSPLEVAPSTDFITCQYCEASLQVIHEGSSVRTEELEAVRGDVDGLHMRVALIELDRAWAEEREGLLIKSQDGSKVAPRSSRVSVMRNSAGTLVIGGPIATALGILLSRGAPNVPGLLLLVSGVIATFSGVIIRSQIAGTLRKVKAYESARKRYLEKRREILKAGEGASEKAP